MDENLAKLINELKLANEECWKAKIVLHELGLKYAPLCIQLIVEMRQIPKLTNNLIEKRMRDTGLDVVHPDFWNTEMLIALAEHLKSMEDT